MNKKSTQTKYTSFEEIFSNSVKELFSHKSPSRLIDYKHLNLVNWNELKLVNIRDLNLVNWNDLKLIDMNLLGRGFQYIGIFSFLFFFISALVLGILLDEQSYKSKLSMSRSNQKFALDKAMYLASQRQDFLARKETTLAMNTSIDLTQRADVGFVLGASDELVIEPPMVSEMTLSIKDTERKSSDEVIMYRNGICSFEMDDVLYSSGSQLSASNKGVICIKSPVADFEMKASMVNGENERTLNMTGNCFSASKVSKTSQVNVSLVGADNVEIGGCNLLVSAL